MRVRAALIGLVALVLVASSEVGAVSAIGDEIDASSGSEGSEVVTVVGVDLVGHADRGLDSRMGDGRAHDVTPASIAGSQTRSASWPRR